MSQNNEVSYFSDQDSPQERRTARILKLASYVGMIACFAMVFVTVWHAIGRYLFNQPVPGNVELACFMLCILIFLVGAYTQVVKGHIYIGLIVDRLPARAQAVIDSFIYILCSGFVVLAVWRTAVQGIDMAMLESGPVSHVLHIPHPPFIFVVAFGWGILGLVFAMQLVRHLRRAARGAKR